MGTTTQAQPSPRVLESLFYSVLSTVIALRDELETDVEEDKKATSENLAAALAAGRWIVKLAITQGITFPRVFN